MRFLKSQPIFCRYAWSLLGYTILVILWGGFVRASGSGAGCGNHWPLCNGEIIPHSPALNTLIEFSHRLTSGMAGILAILLAVWAFFAFGRKTPVFRASVAVLVFMMLEGAVGAGLVLFEYVAYNPSIARAYWMAAHLTNTFFLLAALTLAAWWASGGHLPRFRGNGRSKWMMLASLLGLLVLGASGAVTALGDTLAISGGFDPAQNAVVGTLTGLRIYHPILACSVFVLVAATVFLSERRSPSVATSRFGRGVVGLMLLQLLIGLANVQLHAPVGIQLVHLLMTNLIWIGFILFSVESLPTNDSN